MKILNKRKKMIVVAGVLIITILVLSICIYRKDPVSNIQKYLTAGKWEQAVNCYNKYKDHKQSQEMQDLIYVFLDEELYKWNEEEITYDDVKSIFSSFESIENEELSEKASDNLRYITIENDGNTLLEEAETAFADKKFFESMKAVNSINPAFSQYGVASNLYTESRNLLLYEVTGAISTADDYKEAIQTLDEYSKEINDSVLIDRKKELETQLSEYEKVFKIVFDATDLYEKGEYKESFTQLQDGLEAYPENEKIQYALASYQSAYMLNAAQDAMDFIENENFEEAIDYLEDAIYIYDNEVFQTLLDSAKRKDSFLYSVGATLGDAGDYIYKSGKKLVLGDFDDEEDETALSIGGNIAASVAGVDIPLDARDLAYDITHWGEGEYFLGRFALDAVGVIPVIGAVKYLKHAETIGDAAKIVKKAGDAADIVDDAVDVAKKVDDIPDAIDMASDLPKKADSVSDITDIISNTSKGVDKIVDTADVISDVEKKMESIADVVDGVTDVAKKEDVISDIADEVSDHYRVIKTRNQALENKVHPKTGVKFVRRNIDLADGTRWSGVFPEFDSFAEIELPDDLLKASFNDQKDYLLKELKKMVEEATEDSDLIKRFSENDIDDILNGVLPEGLTWHHNEQEGLMQLVDSTIHAATGHDGGMKIWGAGYD